ncbi:Vi polysaccharide export protein VexE [Sphingomonas sp. F9_3S_D5_B_2]
MEQTVELSHHQQLDGLLRSGQWSEARAFYERELTKAERTEASFRLGYAIALIRCGRDRAGFDLLRGDVLDLPNARADLRRFVAGWLVEQRQFELGAKLLDILLSIDPDGVEDLRLRASLLGRLRRWPEALKDTEKLARARPDDLSAQASYVQSLLQSGEVERAGAHAETLIDRFEESPRLAYMALLALYRSGRAAIAADAAAELAEAEIEDEQLAIGVLRTLLDAERPEKVIEVGERFVAEGWDGPMVRSFVGYGYMASQDPDRYDKAISQFRIALEQTPDDVRMNTSMGEALLRIRSYEAAIPYLEKASRLQPNVPQARALYARALKQAGRYDEAAAEFRHLLEMQPTSSRWRRYAAGALSQAGHRKEAEKLFHSFVTERRRGLPKRFEQGLEALWDRVDTVKIPQARLDWAWELSTTRPNDREEWERKARWGHLADHYLLDWLECRDDRVHEAMSQLADLSEPERALASVDGSNGIILASAHIGPMYAGPLALELMGVRSRWLASTPSVARTAYAQSLISTSDQDDMQVARSFMTSLRAGYSVVIAVDGAINLAAPRVPFEGQEMTYSSFASRTAHRVGAPSFFCAPKWEGDRIGFVLTQMPDPFPEESPDAHADRWRDAFLSALRDYLGGSPENLRLSGGLWRHIR